jgi:hypothetical protein
MGEFLAFRRYLTPIFIQVLFWLGFAGIVIGLLIMGINAMGYGGQGVAMGFVMIFLGIPLMVVMWRVYCEILIVLFRMLETLQSIDQKTR